MIHKQIDRVPLRCLIRVEAQLYQHELTLAFTATGDVAEVLNRRKTIVDVGIGFFLYFGRIIRSLAF